MQADLLDILSNGSSPRKILQHITKVFLATDTLVLEDKQGVLTVATIASLRRFCRILTPTSCALELVRRPGERGFQRASTSRGQGGDLLTGKNGVGNHIGVTFLVPLRRRFWTPSEIRCGLLWNVPCVGCPLNLV